MAAPLVRTRGGAFAGNSTPPLRTVVDANQVVYESIQPKRLTLAAYYDPRTLAPVSAHGNQVIFINLENATSKGAFVTAGSTAWTIDGAGHGGGPPIFTTVPVSGVVEFDLVSLVGEAANGAAGGLIFSTMDAPSANRGSSFSCSRSGRSARDTCCRRSHGSFERHGTSAA